MRRTKTFYNKKYSLNKWLAMAVLAIVVFVLTPNKTAAIGTFIPEKALEQLQDCVSTTGNCQSLTDSLIDEAKSALSKEAFSQFLFEASFIYFSSSQFIEAKSLLSEAKLIENLNPKKELFYQIRKRQSQVYFYEGRFDSSFVLAYEVLVYHQSQNDSLQIGRVKLYLGQILKEQGSYSEALESYLGALGIFRILKDDNNIANAYAEMATLYAMSNENEKAIDYGYKAASIFKALNKLDSYAYVSLNLANNLSFADQPDSAIRILNEVIPIFKEQNEQYMLINAIAQLSRAQYKKGEIKLALSTMAKSNALDPNNNYPSQSIYNFQLMGRMYRDLKDWNEALVYFKKSYVLHQRIGVNDELKTLLEDLASTYDTLNQSDSTLKYYREWQLVTDSLNSVEKENRLSELKEQYEADLREEELRNSEEEIILLEKSNTAKSQRNITLFVILLVVLALTISIISRQRNSIRLNKMLSEQSKKTHKAELQAQTAEKQQLEEDLNHRKRELANQALLIAEKNELLRSFRNEVEKVGDAETENNRSLKRISRQMERAENQQGDWDKFMGLFKDVHPELLKKLAQKNDDLTHNDLRLLALMKMNFTNKEIADILHITDGGLKKARYRLRKKLNLEPQASIHQYIQHI